jgi:hypothetical protein
LENTNVHLFHLDIQFLEWLEQIIDSYQNAPKFCQKKCGVMASKTGSHNHEIIRYEK